MLIVADARLRREATARSGPSRAGAVNFDALVLASPAMERVAALGRRAARSIGPVLIEGEAGVGKAMLAHAIHGAGTRKNRPFVAVDCKVVPADALEALAAAGGGTLFLDGIGALSALAQQALLGILRSGAHSGSPASPPRRDAVRLVAATRRRLVDLVVEGSFRQDLFQLLNVLPIWIPPLRQRRADIPALAGVLVARSSAERRGLHLSCAALDLLAAYDWPGNVRELENAIMRAVALCDFDEIGPEHFPHLVARADAGRHGSGSTAPAAPRPRLPAIGVADARQVDGERGPLPGALPDRSGPARYGLARLLDERGELRPFEALEAEVIRFAVDHCRGRMSEVARRLGIGRSTLYRKLKDYGIVSAEISAP